MIRQHGDGERVRQIENLLGCAAVASQVVQNNGELRAVWLRRRTSRLLRRSHAEMDVHLVRSRATPQIKKENSFAALGRCFGEPMPRSDASESLLNSRGFRLCHGVGFALGQGDVQTICGFRIPCGCLQRQMNLRSFWCSGVRRLRKFSCDRVNLCRGQTLRRRRFLATRSQRERGEENNERD